MRIALLYPPPWKIAPPGAATYPPGEGPPRDYREGDLDPDFHQTPYGLFTLGAQALAAGHPTKVYNLSGYDWPKVEEIIASLDADLFGMSCWTANRRGVAFTASAIKRSHPNAHVIVGGPHATPLGVEMLRHHPDIDTVALGESEETFVELIGRLERGEPTTGIAGSVYRQGGEAVLGPERAAIKSLDVLASPHDWFDTHIVMTSRGCPWQCTFCGAETTWGRGFRGRSVPRVLDDLEAALARLPVKMVQIKDDTFTANKKRALEISRGIRERGLRFLWSCDTRVDVLTEQLLTEMRLAGCERLSLGVESGSQKILDAINKKITVDEILEATALAKKVGIKVRFYMMLGNRGETRETFHETVAFLDTAKPHQYLFSCLSIYPGTTDFHDAEKSGRLDREIYFTDDFQELKTPFDASAADTALMSEWFEANRGLRTVYRESVDDCRAILARLGDHAPAHLDLAGALLRDGLHPEAEHHARRALDLGHPCPGLCMNYLACAAHARGDLAAMQELFLQAARTDPQHHVLIQNVQAARRWFAERGPERGLPLELIARHEFELLERTVQPTLPGPLPPDFAEWQAPARPREAVGAPPPVAGPRGKLRVVS